MEHYFSFKGISSKEFGLKTTTPAITRSPSGDDKIIIPGRSGFLSLSYGTYGYTTKKVDCRVYSEERLDALAAWLTGSGKLIFSSEPDKYYKGTVNGAIPIEYMLMRYRAFTVSFDCQPFKYNVNDAGDAFDITQSTKVVHGVGTMAAEPVITVYGSGSIELTVNSTLIKLSQVNGEITINSEIMDAYALDENANSKMNGDFPSLLVNGEKNTFSYKGNVTKIHVKPNWRWL